MSIDRILKENGKINLDSPLVKLALSKPSYVTYARFLGEEALIVAEEAYRPPVREYKKKPLVPEYQVA